MAPSMDRRRVALALVLVVSLVGGLLTLSGCGGDKVPDVTNMKPADAIRTLQDAGYLLGETTAAKTDKVPIGFVAYTSPAAGEKLKEGSTVDIAVNAGTGAEVAVPTLTGSTQEFAENTVKGIGLIPVAAESYSATVAAGIVMAQVPAPGSRVPEGAQVVIQVSKGPEPKTVAVPNVNGKTQADAESALKNAGLTPKVVNLYSSSVAKGKVGGQQPAAETKVKPGSEVTIAVSLGKGVGAVTVPNVVGKKEADAKTAMSNAGLKPVVYKANSDTVAAGLVIAQLPGAGTTTGSGSEVAIQVSLGKAPTSGNVSVPNVVGKTQADATSALESAGFTVTPVEQASDTVAVGAVIDQLPVANSTAPKGSAVVILVSTGPAE
jgi:eukaryotic-like serine/threonine-protein kinase